MKKLVYSVLLTFIVFANLPVWGQSQRTWTKVPLEAGPGRQSTNIRAIYGQNHSIPNIPIRTNPLPKVNPGSSDGKEMYGFGTNNPDEQSIGFFKFNSADPSDITVIGNPSEKVIRGGTEANGKYYAIALTSDYFPEGLYTVDPETGEVTQIADYKEDEKVRGATDMSYDYSTGTMYLLTNSDDTPYSSALWTINLADGSQKKIYDDLGESFMTLAVDYEGRMYAVAREGAFYSINKETGKSTRIGDTGITAFFWQSMEFDKATGILYWASYSIDDQSVLCTIDTANGNVTKLGTIGNTDECIGLYIPFDPWDNNAPAAVTDLSVKADPEGNKNALISWTNPVKAYGGSTLSDLSKIEISRNGKVIHTATDTKPGQTSSWTDHPAGNGLYMYRITPYNNAGEGVPKQVSVYVGHDIPAAVNNAKAERVNSRTTQLTWDATTEGVNKGYVDRSSIRYKITRSDGKIVSESQKENSYTDNSITTLARYRYTVEVSNADGTGGSTTTNYVVNGPSLNIPFRADFSKNEDAELWTSADRNNDGNTFALDNYADPQRYVYYSGSERADDWLISPEMSLNSGKHYKIIVSASCGREEYPEEFSICLIRNMNLEHPIELDKFTAGHTSESAFRVNADQIANGEYRIGIRCTSPGLTDALYLFSVNMEENHDGNIRGDVYDTAGTPVEGALVSLEGTDFNASTDKNGEFEIKYIPKGNYSIKCSKLGYKDVSEPVEVKELTTVNSELTISARAVHTVKGTVCNEYGERLSNAAITIQGYNSYKVSSNAKGEFTVDGVYEDENAYQIKATKPFYQKMGKDLTISTNLNFDFILKDKILPPAVASASIKEGQFIPDIEWTYQGNTQHVNYHSNSVYNSFGSTNMDEKVILGILHNQPYVVEAINWKMFAELNELNVVILALDEAGNITPNVLYLDRHALNNQDQETHYVLGSPVLAPSGCFVGIGCNEGSGYIATTEDSADRPFIEGINGLIEDYTNPNLQFVENMGEAGDDFRENFYIDLEGKQLAGKEAPEVKFNIYRSPGDLLNSFPVSDLSIRDSAWPGLGDGTYTYQVESIYRNGEVSERTQTNKLQREHTGISQPSTPVVFARFSGDGHSILFSSSVNRSEVLSVDGKKLAESSDTDRITLPYAKKGVYIVRMQIDHTWYNQKIIFN